MGNEQITYSKQKKHSVADAFCACNESDNTLSISLSSALFRIVNIVKLTKEAYRWQVNAR